MHGARVAYLSDDGERAVAQRVALERDPAPRGVRLTVCVIDYAERASTSSAPGAVPVTEPTSAGAKGRG